MDQDSGSFTNTLLKTPIKLLNNCRTNGVKEKSIDDTPISVMNHAVIHNYDNNV